MDKEKVVMFDSPEAAEYRTNISGWVSRNGLYWGNDERAARYDGCTHIKCEDCGQPVKRGYLICDDCRVKRDSQKYNAMPKEKWNGKGGLVSYGTDLYFWSWEEVDAYCFDNDITEEDLQLVICKPQYLPLLSKYDYGCDELPEDGELPDKVIEAIENFNKVIKKVGPVSWIEGNKAAVR